MAHPSFSRIGSFNPLGTRSALTRAPHELTVVANALTSTSPSAGSGFGTSLICTTSGGPYLSQTAAFIVHPPRRLAARHQRPPPSADRVGSPPDCLYDVGHLATYRGLGSRIVCSSVTHVSGGPSQSM